MDWLENPVVVAALLWFVFKVISRVLSKRTQQPESAPEPRPPVDSDSTEASPPPAGEVPEAVRRWLESMGLEVPRSEPLPEESGVHTDTVEEMRADAGRAEQGEPWPAEQDEGDEGAEEAGYEDLAGAAREGVAVEEEGAGGPASEVAGEEWRDGPAAMSGAVPAPAEQGEGILERALLAPDMGAVDERDAERAFRWAPPRREGPRAEPARRAHRGALFRDALVLDAILVPRRWTPSPGRGPRRG